MIQIGQHIEFLLARHDCVVVPGLGAFLAHSVPSRFDAETETLMPPSRTVGFNPEVNVNDGLLADSVMRRHGLTRQGAMDAIADEVSAMRHQLELSGDVAVGRIGILHRGNEGSTPTFEPLAAEMSLSRFAGLQPVGARLIDRPEKTSVPRVASASRPVASAPRLFKIAASAAAMVCLGLVLSTTTLRHGPEVNHASLDSGLSSSADNVVALAAEKNTAQPERSLYIAVPAAVDALAVVDTATPRPLAAVQPVSNTVQRMSLRFNDADPFIIVVASLASPAQAQKYITEKGDTSLRYVEMDGFYRVYAATALSSASGRAAIASIAGKYPSAWLCLR